MLVYVKRLVKGGPADQSGRIQPGDVLQLINGEDIYGQGLDILREKIPGPAGSTVKLGFRSYAGQLYEVDLARTAYGDQPPEASEQQAYAPQQMQPVAAPQSRVMMVPAAVRVRILLTPRHLCLFLPSAVRSFWACCACGFMRSEELVGDIIAGDNDSLTLACTIPTSFFHTPCLLGVLPGILLELMTLSRIGNTRRTCPSRHNTSWRRVNMCNSPCSTCTPNPTNSLCRNPPCSMLLPRANRCSTR